MVIGRTTRRVGEADALDPVLGYTCLNDVSARDLQFGDGQWVRGKSLDTFCPIGPVLVTADEIADPIDLALSCTVNGEVLQSARTSEMFFGVARIISHCSQAFTLEPGDVIATGTPGGRRRVPEAAALSQGRRPGDDLHRGHRRPGERLPLRTAGPAAGPDGRPNRDGRSTERFLVTGALGCIGAWTVRHPGPRRASRWSPSTSRPTRAGWP